MYMSLAQCGYKTLAQGRLKDLMRRINTFGISLVQLDIRQESERHMEAVDAITKFLGLGSYADWDEAHKQRFLAAAPEAPAPPRAAARRARLRGACCSDKNRRYRNKGGRKLRANLHKFGNNNGLTPPFTTNTFGEFRANPANFAQIRPNLFLSACLGLTPPFITSPFVWFQL